jgi:hypothetical protein
MGNKWVILWRWLSRLVENDGYGFIRAEIDRENNPLRPWLALNMGDLVPPIFAKSAG